MEMILDTVDLMNAVKICGCYRKQGEFSYKDVFIAIVLKLSGIISCYGMIKEMTKEEFDNIDANTDGIKINHNVVLKDLMNSNLGHSFCNKCLRLLLENKEPFILCVNDITREKINDFINTHNEEEIHQLWYDIEDKIQHTIFINCAGTEIDRSYSNLREIVKGYVNKKGDNRETFIQCCRLLEPLFLRLVYNNIFDAIESFNISKLKKEPCNCSGTDGLVTK